MRLSPGRSPRLTKDQRDELKRVIVSQVLADVFTARFNWTLQLIADYIERTYGCQYFVARRPKLMGHMNMSYTKLTYTLAVADPDKQKQFVEEMFPALKMVGNSETDHFLFEDESMICDYQALQRTWFEKGKQRVIWTTGNHRGVKSDKVVGIL